MPYRDMTRREPLISFESARRHFKSSDTAVSARDTQVAVADTAVQYPRDFRIPSSSIFQNLKWQKVAMHAPTHAHATAKISRNAKAPL
mmetsp:Transcript_50785/g.100521  ORF Transcript_50785/g.100521 Transcript_50785/m.100521 type:complete len:88 (-) Transcript_50785:415-678(-)